MPKTFDTNSKELDWNYKIRGKSLHNTTLTSDTNYSFGAFPKSPSDLVARLTELIESYYTDSDGLFQGKDTS